MNEGLYGVMLGTCAFIMLKVFNSKSPDFTI